MNILKYLKVVGIILGIGICQLKSFPYNVITMTRDVDSVSYNRLAEEEIYLVFAQLACRLSSNDLEIRNVLECYKSGLSSKLEKTDIASVKNVNIPTIIVFNEAFFGQDQPLERKQVDQIIEIYKKFMHFLPNAYLYVNFLYTDIQIQGCASQIDISKKRYIEISDMEFEKSFEEFTNPSFLFDSRIEDELNKYADSFDDGSENEIDTYLEKEMEYLENCKKGPQKNQALLFNQTKIFYNGEEIGYYNKSSFCKELGSTNITEQNMYYIIGDFLTIYKQTPPPIPVFCLTCYDIDVITNECYHEKMPKDKICIFASNTSSSLPLAINSLRTISSENVSLLKFCICADPKSEVSAKEITGIYSLNDSNSFKLENGRNIFTIKVFLLTEKEIIEIMKS